MTHADGVIVKKLSYREKRKVRGRLLAIYKEQGKVTERDLLRLSALTGYSYSQIVEVHRSTHYRPREGLKGLIRKIAGHR